MKLSLGSYSTFIHCMSLSSPAITIYIVAPLLNYLCSFLALSTYIWLSQWERGNLRRIRRSRREEHLYHCRDRGCDQDERVVFESSSLAFPNGWLPGFYDDGDQPPRAGWEMWLSIVQTRITFPLCYQCHLDTGFLVLINQRVSFPGMRFYLHDKFI